MKQDLTLEYHGRVTDSGDIELPKRMRRELSGAFRGHRIEVRVRRLRKRRSGEQNRYYWGALIPAVLRAFIDAGNDLQEANPEHRELIHEFLKGKFLDNGLEFHDADGTLHKGPPSTTRLTTVEQEEYHDRIRQFAAEYLNTSIPLPNEQAEIF